MAGVFALAGAAGESRAGALGYQADDSAPSIWTDISGTGTILTDITDEDDEYQSDVPIGFTFSFAGTDYTEVQPTSNGVISLDQEDNDEYDNEMLPTNEFEGAALFPWWDDLDSEEGGDIYAETVGTAPNRAFIVQWHDITHHDDDGNITFQAVLCEGTNNVVYQYLDTVTDDTDSDNGNSASVGMQADEGDGLEYSFDSPVITDGLGIVFYPTGGSPISCLGGPAPTPTSLPPPTAGVTPPAPAPTATTAAVVALPATGSESGDTGSNVWLIIALTGAAVASLAGFAALRMRAR